MYSCHFASLQKKEKKKITCLGFIRHNIILWLKTYLGKKIISIKELVAAKKLLTKKK